MAFFEDIRQKVNKAAQSVSIKTKENAEISRITGEIKNIAAEVESLILQIGHAYVDSKGEDVEGLNALRERVEELHARQAELEQQKVLARNQNICPGCGAVMPKEFKFCSNCGAKMPEPEPEPEPAAEEEPMIVAEPEAEEPEIEEEIEAEEEPKEEAAEEPEQPEGE